MRAPLSVMCSLVLMACVGFSRPASAQPATPAAQGAEATKKADALFQEAMSFIAQQKWTEAEKRLEQAWALNPSYDVAANLGQVQVRLGKLPKAANNLAFALRNWPLVGKQEPRKLAQQRLDDLRKELVTFVIRVNLPGATVLLDGEPIGQSPLQHEIFVDSTMHKVEAELLGYKKVKQGVWGAKGTEQRIALLLIPPEEEGAGAIQGSGPPWTTTAVPEAPTVRDEKQPRSLAPAIALGAVGGVAAGVGIGLLGAWGSKASDAQSMNAAILARNGSCVEGAGNFDPQCGELADTARTGDTFQRVGVGLMVGAGVAFAGAAAYLLWPMPKKTSGMELRAAPFGVARGGGVSVMGSF